MVETEANNFAPKPSNLEKQDIRFISAIDNKPIQPPYLKLLTFEQYLEAERTTGNEGLAKIT